MVHIRQTHAHGRVAADFYCGGCGHEAVAIVEASGMASGGSADARHDEAVADMNANAYKLANCAPCPRCNFVNTRHIFRLKLRAWIYALLVPVGLLLVSWPMVGGGFSATTLAAMGIVGGGIFVIGSLPMFLILRSKWWANAADRVHFGD